jgi:hypothetical protein
MRMLGHIMNKLHEDFACYARQHGAPLDAQVATQEQIDRLALTLPDSIVSFIKKYGFGSYFNKLYRMCDAEVFEDILALIFKADKDFSHKDCLIVGHSAFGFLWVWSKRHMLVRIDLPMGMIFSRELAPTSFKDLMLAPRSTIDPNRIATGLLPVDKDEADYPDVSGEPMYDRCRELYGTPDSGECFGFFPALAIRGISSPARRVENIQRVKALEHYALLAQLDTFYLTKLGPQGFEAVRPIG